MATNFGVREGVTGRGTTTAFRSAISRNRLTAGIVAGLVATHLATVTGFWYHGIFLPDLNWPAFNGLLLLGQDASPLSQFWAGTVYHYLTGLSYSLIYVFAIHPLIPIRNSTAGNLAKALLFGLGLAIISAGWWVPQLFPDINAGFFSHHLGARLLLGIFLWHFVYGLNLGLLYNPLPAED